ncbi:radical SAM protein [bacterium]|nr:radical SAM protein [bacterium]
MLAKSIKYGLRALPHIVLNRKVYPYYASFKLTDRCRFRCPFCNVWKEPAPEMTTEEVKRVLDNLADCSLFMVSLEGGEPLMRDDIPEILEYAGRQPYFILFTTSERDILSYPWDEYTKHIDFLHISIDEGHNNLFLFDKLPELSQYHSVLTVQTVVAQGQIDALEVKVKRCKEAGAKILIMPAVHLEGTKDHFPKWEKFRDETLRLKRLYPQTIITPSGYFDNYAKGNCSASSIIIDCDGGLYYPCRTLNYKPVNLLEVRLKDFLKSPPAEAARAEMKLCQKRCGWYQYFAIDVFTNPLRLLEGVYPYFHDLFKSNGGRRR